MQLTLISFPRSGQHLVTRLLRFYCENQGIEFSYCGFYSHCNQTPCASGWLFQKNHDLDLKLPIKPTDKYLVLYRSNMIAQLDAWFRFDVELNWGLKHNPGIANYDYPEKKAALIAFMEKDWRDGKTRDQYYLGFIKKWVMCANENVFKLEYDSWLAKPEKFLPVFRHLLPAADHTKDQKIFEEFCAAEPIVKQTHVDLDFNPKDYMESAGEAY